MKNDLDILLIHPNSAKRVYQDLSNNFSAIEPPIWALMIASYLINKGWNVEILDCEALRLNPKEVYTIVKNKSPKVIGMVVYGQQPSASTQNMTGAIDIMHKLADLDITRIYIGPHPSSLPIRTIEDDPGALVCQGEGPITLDILLKQKNHKDISDRKKVPGLWYFNYISGKIEGNCSAPLLRDLDNDIPNLPLDLLPLEQYRTSNWHSWTNENKTQPFLSLYTSLGCPFQCSFCMINSPFNNGDNKNNTFRTWSPAHTLRILRGFTDKGVTNVKIADEMFVLKPPHFLEICKGVIDSGMKFNLWAYARIDTVREQYLDILKKAGVNWLALGIESGNIKVRQEVIKGKFQELNIHDIVSKIQNHGICSMNNFIFGLPTDTIETMQSTLDLAMNLNGEYANMYCAMGYPGSQLHRDFSQHNPSVLPENNGVGWIGYSQHAYETFNLPTEVLKNHEILKFRDEAVIKYFSNPSYLEKMTLKFGPNFKTEIQNMLNIRLKRKILGD